MAPAAFGSLFGSKSPTLGKLLFGAYGKLPLSKEFLRIRCSDGAGHAFYQWVNEGYDQSVASLGGVPGPSGRWQWLFFPDGFKEVILATQRDSADHGGERKFPFLCFALARRDKLDVSLAQQLTLTAPLFDQLWQIDESLSACSSRGEFQEAVAKVALDGVLPKADGSALGAALWPALGDPAQLIATVYETARALRVLSSGTVPGSRLPSLRLPVVSGDAMTQRAHAIAWATMLDRTPWLNGRRSPVSFAVPVGTSAESSAASAWLVPRVPRPSDYTMLGSGESQAGSFFPDPGGELARVEVEAWTDFAARASRAFGSDDATFADLAGFSILGGDPQ